MERYRVRSFFQGWKEGKKGGGGGGELGWLVDSFIHSFIHCLMMRGKNGFRIPSSESWYIVMV